MTFVYATVTCKDKAEAETIAQALLADKLIACSKITAEVSQTYWWKGNLETGTEVMLIMETHESRLPRIEETLNTIHSYETFVLTAVPMVFVSREARLWLQEVLNLL